MVICIHIGLRPYARLLAPYRGDMGYCAPNHRGKPLRYIIKPRWGKNLLPSYIFPLTSDIRHRPSDMLPQEFFDVTTEGGLLGPAVVLEGLADVALDIGR